MSTFLTDVELRRETAVRRYVCPTCHVARNKPCRSHDRTQSGYSLEVSHTSRYLKAVALGLVPPLPGQSDA